MGKADSTVLRTRYGLIGSLGGKVGRRLCADRAVYLVDRFEPCLSRESL
jgi:hypothetical protein